MPVTLSVIVCTRNRLDRLKGCVEALLAVNTTHAWELVIVDNGSTDGTSDYLATLGMHQHTSVRVVTELVPGLGRAQNAGWRASRGEIVANTDDDCYVQPDYVDAVINAFNATEIGFVGGRVLLFDPSDSPLTTLTRDIPFDQEPRTFVATGDILGANQAFRRSVLEKIGGFDPDLGTGTPFCCNDTDAQARAVWNDIKGRYDPRIVVLHHHGRRPGSDHAKLTREYDRGRGAYYAKMILGPRSRRTYLRILRVKLREDFHSAQGFVAKWEVFRARVREGLGAAWYFSRTLWRPSKVPAC